MWAPVLTPTPWPITSLHIANYVFCCFRIEQPLTLPCFGAALILLHWCLEGLRQGSWVAQEHVRTSHLVAVSPSFPSASLGTTLRQRPDHTAPASYVSYIYFLITPALFPETPVLGPLTSSNLRALSCLVSSSTQPVLVAILSFRTSVHRCLIMLLPCWRLPSLFSDFYFVFIKKSETICVILLTFYSPPINLIHRVI